MKRCPGCAVALPLSEYGNNKRAKDGLQSRCKPCTRKAVKASHAKRNVLLSCPTCGKDWLTNPRHRSAQCHTCARGAVARGRATKYRATGQHTISRAKRITNAWLLKEQQVATKNLESFAIDAYESIGHVVITDCVVCHEAIVACSWLNDRRVRYCSNECKRRNGRKWISEESRQAIYIRDDYTCWLCNEPVDLNYDANEYNPRLASLDHVVPRSKGGDHSTENLRTAHVLCNSLRSDLV